MNFGVYYLGQGPYENPGGLSPEATVRADGKKSCRYIAIFKKTGDGLW
jgi:hypothetical protein